MLTAILILVGIGLFFVAAWCDEEHKGLEEAVAPFSVFLFLVGLIALGIKCVCIYMVFFSAPAYLEVNKLNTPIVEQKIKEYENIVRSELGQYPQYEKSVLASIDSSIILKYPELKANTTIIESFKSMIKYRDELYQLKMDRNQIVTVQKMQMKLIKWF